MPAKYINKRGVQGVFGKELVYDVELTDVWCPHCGKSFDAIVSKLPAGRQDTRVFVTCTACGEEPVVTLNIPNGD